MENKPTSHEKYCILDAIAEQKESQNIFPDEYIFSNIYYASLSNSLRSISKRTEKEQLEINRKNDWLYTLTDKIYNIPVLDMDNLKNYYKFPHVMSFFMTLPQNNQIFIF